MSISSFSSAAGASPLAAEFDARLNCSAHDPLVSVIIPVYDNWDVTERCLASVIGCDMDVPLELIVVDDCSTDGTAEGLARLPGVKVVRNARNVGFVHGCNRGASVALGTYLFFLNNDTELRSGSIAALVRRMEADDGIGIVGSKLLYPDGTLQEAGGIVWSDAFVWNYGRLDDVDRPEYNFARDVDYVSGAALLVRTALFREIGSFDVRYAPAYYEDADLCFAARARGMRVVYEPASVVVHYEGLTAGRDVNAGIKRFYEINRPKFESKWYATLRSRHHVFAESNVRRAARGRGDTKPAVLVVAECTPGNATPAARRLRALVGGLARGGHRVVFLPHDLEAAQPWTAEMQDAGVEVLFRVAGDPRGWSDHLAEALATVDAVLVSGADLCALYLPAIRAQRDVPVVYDAAEAEGAADVRAACIAAADGTLVGSELEAQSIRAAGLGPVAMMPAARDAEPAAPLAEEARRLIESLVARAAGSLSGAAAPRVPASAAAAARREPAARGVPADHDQARVAALFERFVYERARADQLAPERDRFADALAAAAAELDRERAAHRKTYRREAEARLAHETAGRAVLQQAAELERLAGARSTDDAERNLLLLQLARAQSRADALAAELDAVARDVEPAAPPAAEVETREPSADGRGDLLDQLAAMAALAEAHGANVQRLQAQADADRDERAALALRAERAEVLAGSEAAAALEAHEANAALRAQLAALADGNRALLEFVAELQERCRSADDALAGILGSRSWRLTAPMRRMLARTRPGAESAGERSPAP